jgi:hypothetical protein
MCEKATEIQDSHREEKWKSTGKWKAGDFWVDIARSPVHVVDNYQDAWRDVPDYIHHPYECVWLPRQDQLQEMIVKEESAKLADLEMRFHDFCLDPTTIYVRKKKYLHSMEQLWLAFVMREKYNKVWNGEEWVKEGVDG